MNAREANLIAQRYQARVQAFNDLHALLAPFFRRTPLAASMNEISECVSNAWDANTLCGWLPDFGDFDELEALVGEIRRDGGRKRFTSLNDIPPHMREHFDKTDKAFTEFADEIREECRDGYDSLLEQQEILNEHLESVRFDQVFAFDEDSLEVETTRLINQVFDHLHTQWVAYEKLARSLVGMAHLIDEPDPDKGLTEALLFD
ncbi:hypothetical protein ACYZT8_03190 [Pseudomonas sp. LB3P93]